MVSLPAFATSGSGELIIVIVSVDGVQIPLLMVHLNTKVPIAIEVMVVVGDEGVVIAGTFGPLTCVQVPVDAAFPAFPARVALVWLHKSCEGPALAVVCGLAVITTVVFGPIQVP